MKGSAGKEQKGAEQGGGVEWKEGTVRFFFFFFFLGWLGGDMLLLLCAVQSIELRNGRTQTYGRRPSPNGHPYPMAQSALNAFVGNVTKI